MARPFFQHHQHLDLFSDEAVIRIITEQLPAWKAACGNSTADTVLLQQRAFGNSKSELLLLALAVRYAGIVRKNITIIA
jgi:hypothetical protein